MKFVMLALAVLVASVNTLPQVQVKKVDLRDERIIDSIIIAFIEELLQLIQDLGLDPYYLDSAEGSYYFLLPTIFSASGSAQSVSLNGLSDVTVNDVSYSLISGALFIDITFNQVAGSVGAASGEVSGFGYSLSGVGSGSLAINSLRISGSAIVRLGGDGVSIDNINIGLKGDSIVSNINLVINDRDFSDSLNNFLSVTVPDFIDNNPVQVTQILNLIVRYLVDRFL